MINEGSFVTGRCYFLLSYYNDDMSIPDIESYIYVGKNVMPSDKKTKEEWWYFQSPETYLKLGSFFLSDDERDLGVLRTNSNTLELFCDLEGLIQKLSDIRR